MEQPFDTEKSFQVFSRLLIAPARNLHIVQKQLHGLLSAATNRQLKKLSSTMELFTKENAGGSSGFLLFGGVFRGVSGVPLNGIPHGGAR